MGKADGFQTNAPHGNAKHALTTNLAWNISVLLLFQNKFLWNYHLIMRVHGAERCINPSFFFHPLFLDIPPFFRIFRNMHLHLLTPIMGNTRFYDDILELGRLKVINRKPWKPITYRNCVLYWMFPDRYHGGN